MNRANPSEPSRDPCPCLCNDDGPGGHVPTSESSLGLSHRRQRQAKCEGGVSRNSSNEPIDGDILVDDQGFVTSFVLLKYLPAVMPNPVKK